MGNIEKTKLSTKVLKQFTSSVTIDSRIKRANTGDTAKVIFVLDYIYVCFSDKHFTKSKPVFAQKVNAELQSQSRRNEVLASIDVSLFCSLKWVLLILLTCALILYLIHLFQTYNPGAEEEELVGMVLSAVFGRSPRNIETAKTLSHLIVKTKVYRIADTVW